MIITFYKTGKNGTPRYYSIHDRQGNLFAEHSFTVVWGVRLDGGRQKSYDFDTQRAMDKKLRFIFKKRIQTGYKVLYSFSRKKEEKQLFEGLEKSGTA